MVCTNMKGGLKLFDTNYDWEKNYWELGQESLQLSASSVIRYVLQ